MHSGTGGGGGVKCLEKTKISFIFYLMRFRIGNIPKLMIGPDFVKNWNNYVA